MDTMEPIRRRQVNNTNLVIPHRITNQRLNNR